MKCCECPVYDSYSYDYRLCQGTKPNNLEHNCVHGNSVKGKKFNIQKSEEPDNE